MFPENVGIYLQVYTALPARRPISVFISKMTVFWDVVPCSLVEFYRLFTGDYCIHHQGMMEAGSTSETSVNLY
jgi:hypothetical protein